MKVLLFLQVHLQTQKEASKGLLKLGVDVVKNDGILGLYSGISASILRQVQNLILKFKGKTLNGLTVMYLLST